MKTTVGLPDALVQQVKFRALRDGRKLKDAVADLLRKGLSAANEEAAAPPPMVRKEKDSGLPVIQCQRTAAQDEELTPERVADILLDQEASWHHATGR